jgi:hypothetical protein
VADGRGSGVGWVESAKAHHAREKYTKAWWVFADSTHPTMMSTATTKTTATAIPHDEVLARVRAFPLRIGVADILFLVCALGMIQRSRGSMLDDPGLGWHIRNIDAMWAAGGWLSHDPFTLPIQDWPWRTNVWLGDLALWLSWQWAGLEGIAAVTVLVLTLTFRMLYQMLVADEVPWPLAAMWTLLAALGTSLSWVARPNVFSIPLLMLVAWICDRYHRGLCTRRQTLWMLPLFALWVNLHGGFMAGLIVLAVTLAVETGLAFGIPHAKDRPAARRRATHVALLLAGSLLATLANPYGWELYGWIGRLLANDTFMNLNTEWKSPDFHGLGAMRFEFFILALPVLIALSRRRPSLVALAISVAFLHLALNGQRYVALWVVVTAPMVARLSVDVPWLRGFAERWVPSLLRPVHGAREAEPLVQCVPRQSLGTSWLATGAVAGAFLIWSRLAMGAYSYHAPHNIPVAALQTALAHADGRPIFHHYNWGGWIVWHGWPKVHSFIDDRNEVHGEAHIREYFSIIDAEAGWQQKIAKYDFVLICIPPHKPLAQQLAGRREWREIHRDEFAVVFQRQ